MSDGPETSGSDRHGGARARSIWRSRTVAVRSRIRALISAIEAGDEETISATVLDLSRSRRLFAPLAFAVGAVVLLFNSLKLLVTNWRLSLIQILPAMLIWAAMLDLRLHVLYGRGFHPIREAWFVPLFVVVVVLTAVGYYLNAVFAFAIAGPGRPEIAPAVRRARRHLGVIGLTGGIVGVLLAAATLVMPRVGRPWFTLSLGIVIGIMMVSYVAVPARLIGIKPEMSPLDKAWTTAFAWLVSVTVCLPPYLIGRLGILMLGAGLLAIPGALLIAVGATLQAGATGAVRALKMSARLSVTGRTGPLRT